MLHTKSALRLCAGDVLEDTRWPWVGDTYVVQSIVDPGVWCEHEGKSVLVTNDDLLKFLTVGAWVRQDCL